MTKTMKRLSRLSDIAFFFYIGSVAHDHFGNAPAGFAAIFMAVTWVWLLPATWRSMRRAKQAAEAIIPVPKAAPKKMDLSAQQLLLVEKVNNPNNDRRFQDMIELWESIYGQPADLTRPMHDIIAEVSVALIEKSS